MKFFGNGELNGQQQTDLAASIKKASSPVKEERNSGGNNNTIGAKRGH